MNNIIIHNILLYIIYTSLFKCGYCLCMYNVFILNTRWNLKFSIHLNCLQFMNIYTFVYTIFLYAVNSIRVASSQ